MFALSIYIIDIIVDIYLEYKYFNIKIIKHLTKNELNNFIEYIEDYKFTKPSYYSSERQTILLKKYHYDLSVILKITL